MKIDSPNTARAFPNPRATAAEGPGVTAAVNGGETRARQLQVPASTTIAAEGAKRSPLPTGYDARKALPLWDFMFGYFPLAWLAVADVAVQGNKQHNPGEPLHWARHKSTDQLNTAFRHQFDHGMGEVRDTDGCYHLAKAIWRLSAELQLLIEKENARAAQ